MNDMIDVRLSGEAMLLLMICATAYLRTAPEDDATLKCVGKIKEIERVVSAAFWEQICERGAKCEECSGERSGRDCELRKEMEGDHDEQKGD